MKKTIITIILAIAILLSYVLPEFWKELFVAETGKISHGNGTTVFFMVLGLFLNWKYMKEIILVMFGFSAILSLSLVSSIWQNMRPGFYFLVPDIFLIVILTLWLISIGRTEKLSKVASAQ